MKKSYWNCIFNHKYLVKYKLTHVNIYEISSNTTINLLLNFQTNIQISSIEFNPLVYNIIIISFINGTCKIYNILNKSDKGDITFECIKNNNIVSSIFNIFDPNIVATINEISDIFIWDIRKPYFFKEIDNIIDIINTKWSHFDKNYLEIVNINQTIRLVNIDNKNIEAIKEVSEPLIDFFYLKDNILILIKNKQLEKINFVDNNIIDQKRFDIITYSKDNLIKDNNILVIISKNILYFIDILTFSEILKKDFYETNFDTFFYIKKDNEIGLNYVNQSNLLKESSFKLENKKLNYNENINLDNIKHNFYEKYSPKIFKYLYLLNSNENINKEQKHIKLYMNINEVNKFFNEIKEVNIFIRKVFITDLFNKKINFVNKELNISKFPEIQKIIDIFETKNLKTRKNIFIQKIKENSGDHNFIKEFYIEIVKLLTIDNTNEKLLEIYLLYIKLNEEILIKIFGESNVEKYNDEIKYYSVCYSKESYKELFDLDKKSEKEILFEFLNKAYKLQNFDIKNYDLKRLIEDLKNSYPQFPKFNMPIEYDSNNDELKWFSIKLHIFLVFKNLKLKEKNQDIFYKIRKGLKAVIEKKLFENQDILKDKYKLQSVLFLIINPCSMDDNSLEFFCNSILSNSNSLNEIKGKFTIINEQQIEYHGIIYDNYKDLCINNLIYEEFAKEEKYSFNYLLNNHVNAKNQNEIKQFLKNILKKRVFVDVYEILFGNKNSKLLNERYLEELIEKRFIFAPIRPGNTLAVSDKISLNTLLSTKQRDINSKTNKIKFENLKEILNTGNYVLNGEHEIFHLLNCIPYYENNCSISINTPRKKNVEMAEGGNYLELLLFNKTFDSINLGEALFILNEENYDKSLIEFKTAFESKNYNDLTIKGVFEKFNNYLNISNISNEELNNSYINQKSSNNSNLVFDSYIINYLENDVVGILD